MIEEGSKLLQILQKTTIQYSFTNSLSSAQVRYLSSFIVCLMPDDERMTNECECSVIRKAPSKT